MDNRRGFFSKIGSLFEKEGEAVFFGVQFAINVFGEDSLRSKLHDVIESGGVLETPAEKRSYYKRIAALLRENIPFLEYGYWELNDKQDEAEREFNSWITEITASMATEKEEMGDDIDEMFRMSSDKSYVVVTLLFLLENSDRLSSFFERVDNIDQEEYFTNTGFSSLVDAIAYVDFEYSYGDASFIMPGNDEDGLAFEDIRGEGWDYLRPVMPS
jgi:hypothetical protein